LRILLPELIEFASHGHAEVPFKDLEPEDVVSWRVLSRSSGFGRILTGFSSVPPVPCGHKRIRSRLKLCGALFRSTCCALENLARLFHLLFACYYVVLYCVKKHAPVHQHHTACTVPVQYGSAAPHGLHSYSTVSYSYSTVPYRYVQYSTVRRHLVSCAIFSFRELKTLIPQA